MNTQSSANISSSDGGKSTFLESVLVTLVALGFFLPFLAVQYDTNGLVEASAVEAGALFHKNHLLYRVVGYGVYRAVQLAGYRGRAILVLQIISAVCGAIGVGLAYVVYKRTSQDRLAAVSGTLLLASSFSYWLFSADAAYISLAAMFATAAAAVFLCLRSRASGVVAAGFTTLSVLTWQASIFLIPALVLLSPARTDTAQKDRRRDAVIYIAGAAVFSGIAYVAVAFIQSGLMNISSLIRWSLSYGEGGTLPMWGKWEAGRALIAAGSALGSLLPVRLSISLSELNRGVQLGRIAIDLSLALLGLLTVLAMLRIRPIAIWFLIAYAVFLPFIVWWDPFEPKWFFIPNIFLAGCFAIALAPWFRSRYSSIVVLAALLFIAATNFVTTIRPRHREIGPDRRMAQCVAEKMQPNDLLIAAEWGWPDYMEYVYGRRMVSVIGNISALEGRLAELRQVQGAAYTPDPAGYSDSHLAWLRSQSGVTGEDLRRLADTPAFSCYGRTIYRVRP